MSNINGLPAIRVHRNLHNARRGGPQWVRTAKGKVAEYLEAVVLTGVTTRIQPAGQRKCQESGTRSVCAYFDGQRTGKAHGVWHKVSYDPRSDDSFTAWVEGKPVPWNTADAAHLRADGSTWVTNPTWEV
jgi:hypothetical protein